MTNRESNLNAHLRALPSVDALLRTPEARSLGEEVGIEHLTRLARAVTEELRASLLKQSTGSVPSNGDDSLRSALLSEAVQKLGQALARESMQRLRHVINATGVILHTNLGRAPLSDAARLALAEEAARYCTLEYDAERGRRGARGSRVESLLAELTGAESSLVVNNCAAAALLVLTVLASGGEAVVSRGELVEIGGDFRVPEVMAQSGTRLVEVGTTNRTRLSDYEQAINANTRLLMRVHTSNYRIVGFTAAPSLAELVKLAHDSNLPLYEDAGSGALIDLRPYGLEGEPLIADSIACGVDVITFSGDKLLGGCQAGLVVGRREIIERMRKNALYRALRADKLALAALQATLEIYRRGASLKEIPALRMLALTKHEVEGRARRFLAKLKERLTNDSLSFEIQDGQSAIGGGAAPTTHPSTALIALKHSTLAAVALDEKMRRSDPPVIARIAEDRVLLDLRTVAHDEEDDLLEALLALSN